MSAAAFNYQVHCSTRRGAAAPAAALIRSILVSCRKQPRPVRLFVSTEGGVEAAALVGLSFEFPIAAM
jgi:hypothetical protein